MTFDLHIHGETPEELLDALNHLGGTTNIINASPAPQPQSEPVTQPDKPKVQTSAKAKKAAQKPAAAPAEEPANPTHTPAQNTDAAATAESPAVSAQSPTTTTQADAGTSTTELDSAALDKIRDLARSLIVAGKRAGVQAAIKATGAASVSKLPPDSYTSVWEELLKLKDEVDANASN